MTSVTDSNEEREYFYKTSVEYLQRLLLHDEQYVMPFFDAILKVANPSRDWTCLDLGCGTGRLANLLATVSRRVDAVDISPLFLSHASEDPRVNFIPCGWEEFVSEHGYDLVVSSHLMEHVNDPRSFSEMLYKSTKVNGIIAVESPNLLSPREPIRRAFGKRHYDAPRPLHLGSRLANVLLCGRNVMRCILGFLGDSRVYEYCDRNPNNWIGKDGDATWLCCPWMIREFFTSLGCIPLLDSTRPLVFRGWRYQCIQIFRKP